VTKTEIALAEKRMLSVDDCCALSSRGRSKVRAAIAAGELAARKHGKSTLVRPEDLQSWIESFPPYVPHPVAANNRPRHYRRAQAAATPAEPATPSKREAAADRARAVAQRAKPRRALAAVE
jgi:hypothetical protein